MLGVQLQGGCWDPRAACALQAQCKGGHRSPGAAWVGRRAPGAVYGGHRGPGVVKGSSMEKAVTH